MAIKANLIIDQGATYATKLNITDANGSAVDLTGYTAAAQIRKHYTSSNSTPFSVSLTAATGAVVLSLSSNATANLISGRYVYDVELTDGAGRVSRIIEGTVTITPNVTR
jgi:hypothetical protein